MNNYYKATTKVYLDGKYMQTLDEMWTYERIQKEIERLNEMHEKGFISFTQKIVNGAYLFQVYF